MISSPFQKLCASLDQLFSLPFDEQVRFSHYAHPYTNQQALPATQDKPPDNFIKLQTSSITDFRETFGDNRFQWVPWCDDQGKRGLAISALIHEKPSLLLPPSLGGNPSALRLPLSLLEYSAISLFDPDSKKARYQKQGYFRGDRLTVKQKDLREDRIGYRKFLEGPSVGSFQRFVPGIKGKNLCENCREKDEFYRVLLALQRGLQFILGEKTRGFPAFFTVPIHEIQWNYEHFSEWSTDSQITSGPLHGIATDHYFGGGDPRTTRVKINIQDLKLLLDRAGNQLGEARICAGGPDAKALRDSVNLYAFTNCGGRENNEDGFYTAAFRLSNGTLVRILAGADGVGGTEHGEIASSAALQGVHAGIIDAIRENRVPLAGDLFDHAFEALYTQIKFVEHFLKQKFQRGKRPDTLLTIIVIAGDQATIATTGDFMVLKATQQKDGTYLFVEYSDVDNQGPDLVNSTVGSGYENLYVTDMEPGDVLLTGSDGLLGSLIDSYKLQCSYKLREFFGKTPPDQGLFSNIGQILQHTHPHFLMKGIWNVIHQNTQIPGREPGSHYPSLSLLPPESDNWTALAAYQRGIAPHRPLFLPSGYRRLESIPASSKPAKEEI